MDVELREKVRTSRNQGDIYEQIIIGLYVDILKENSVAVDGGGNTGWHTLGMADHLVTGTVHSFEPAPELFKILHGRSLKYGNRIAANCLALSDFTGVASFNFFNEPEPNHPQYPLWNGGLSGLKSDEERLRKGHQVLEVNVTTLDGYFALLPMSRLDFVKMDVEGAEYHAIKGGSNTLKRFRPLIAFEDGGPSVGKTYNYLASDFEELFDNLGYDLFDILGEPYRDDEWSTRKKWRPFYSLAIPRQFDAREQISSIIQRTVMAQLR